MSFPSVTAVISKNLGWNKRALMHWANQCGLAGKRHHHVAAAAARAGTLCHAMIDAHLKGKCLSTLGFDAEALEKAQSGFNNFLCWARSVELKPLYTEAPLVSSKHQYRGTLDFVGAVSGKLAVVDWKTSEKVFPEMLIQLGAYGALWAENYPDRPLTGGFHLLCVGKQSASFSHYHWDVLPGAMEGFLHLLALEELKTTLKGLNH